MLMDTATQLEQRITDIITRVAGVGTDPDYYIKTFDFHLRDFEVTDAPFCVVTVRSAVQSAWPSALGQDIGPRDWTVHIYLLDVIGTFEEGKSRRNAIIDRIWGEVSKNWNLDAFEIVSSHGKREYVVLSEPTNLLLDYSGQDEYYSFVSELYMTVHTDTTDV